MSERIIRQQKHYLIGAIWISKNYNKLQIPGLIETIIRHINNIFNMDITETDTLEQERPNEEKEKIDSKTFSQHS